MRAVAVAAVAVVADIAAVAAVAVAAVVADVAAVAVAAVVADVAAVAVVAVVAAAELSSQLKTHAKYRMRLQIFFCSPNCSGKKSLILSKLLFLSKCFTKYWFLQKCVTQKIQPLESYR